MSKTKKIEPKFLSSKPDGQDKIEGQSQTKVAQIIRDLIKDNKLDKKIIGLEGEWGSGKSNVIEILKKELGEQEYYTFVFDAWGYQEDLTRRIFLEQIISELTENKFLTDEEKWLTKTDELLAKKSRSTKQTFPKFKIYWVLLSIGILLLTGLSGFYENVLKDEDLFTSFDLGVFKPLIAIYLLPSILIIWGLYLALREYKKELNANKTRENKLTHNQIVGKVFFWLSGKNIESHEFENIVDHEPSVRQFRAYFDEIEKDLKDKKVIVVFDNLDRLDRDKIKALWSSIHTFFAEHNYDKIWVIVPYDKQKLAEAHDHANTGNVETGNGFIEKTFSISFRVSPPIVSAWDKLLEEKLEQAFGANTIPHDEITYLKEVFDRNTNEGTIKPRQIINYVNQLVSLYKQWRNEVDAGEIKFRYLGLFIRTKDEILLDPAKNVLSRDYLDNSAALFTNDDDLDNVMATLVYNVDRSKADEILLKRELTQSIRNGETEFIESSKRHSVFFKYFDQAYKDVDYPTKRKHLVKVLGCIEGDLPSNVVLGYWEHFADHLLSSEKEFSSFKDEYGWVAKNIKENKRKPFLKALFEGLSKRINVEEDSTQKDYYNEVVRFRKFMNEHVPDYNWKQHLPKVEFDNSPFVDMIENEREDYKELNITCPEEKVIDFFYSESGIEVDGISSWNWLFEIIKDDYDLNRLSDDLRKKLFEKNYKEGSHIAQIIEVLQVLNASPLNLKLSQNVYSQLTETNFDAKLFPDLICIAISDFNNAFQQATFGNTLSSIDISRVEEFSKLIECYISYGDLIKLITESGDAKQYDLLKAIVVNLTDNPNSFSQLNLNWVLSNFGDISGSVFPKNIDNVTSFVKRLNSWQSHYESSMFDSLDSEFLTLIGMDDLSIIKKVTADAKDYVDGLSKEELLEAFKSSNRDYLIIENLLDKNKLTQFSDSFYSAFDDYMMYVIEEEHEDELNTWFIQTLIKLLEETKVKGIFARVRDKVLENPSNIGYKKIDLFINPLIKVGDLGENPDLVTYKLLDYIFESKPSINLIFEKNYVFFIETALKSKKYIEDAKTTVVNNIENIESPDIKTYLIDQLSLKKRIATVNKDKET
ncbi:P-loop NTPase fold protein [Wandonia haliotis]|uniref:P-loop NTPase fold protein n=1 Tax=Wandonia haliotis TaxID=574963 RepID=A0ABP3Y3X6_9FLAO